MLFLQAPADTTGYMIFGFVVILGTMLGYLVSMYMRQRNLQQDLALMEDLKEE